MIFEMSSFGGKLSNKSTLTKELILSIKVLHILDPLCFKHNVT